MSQALTKEQVFSSDDRVFEPVPVDEWKQGGVVFVRSITAAERGKIIAEAARFRESNGKNSIFMQEFDVNFVILAACDEQGNLLFEKSDKAELLKRNAAVIARIAGRAQKLAGMSKEDLEALEKNFRTTQSEDSHSESA